MIAFPAKFALPLAIAVAPLLGGCATTMNEPVRVGPEGQCDATSVQSMLGRTASSETGAQLLAETGARTLRWVPPRTAVTMDYRADRLTVSYDDAMIIDRISCG
ncbi:I78 family peptidase inhibitor [Croceicoccus bisphenolivorans]|uniref:I78 family peptidase inhibitor n=1 Tax=Croceicoccus bisphenolivorans TaxID=1783232 RepID=UPI00082E6B31|nr:I78 family peptidase inhibitor [Croceicoccus bisphenolivorans]